MPRRGRRRCRGGQLRRWRGRWSDRRWHRREVQLDQAGHPPRRCAQCVHGVDRPELSLDLRDQGATGWDSPSASTRYWADPAGRAPVEQAPVGEMEGPAANAGTARLLPGCRRCVAAGRRAPARCRRHPRCRPDGGHAVQSVGFVGPGSEMFAHRPPIPGVLERALPQLEPTLFGDASHLRAASGKRRDPARSGRIASDDAHGA